MYEMANLSEFVDSGCAGTFSELEGVITRNSVDQWM
jgi:hypothetical protein